jgi:NodT family efflux transporter outer membrane factor (OMF) lipoprotein
MPPWAPTGLPSDLLQRRPDIQSAEARLAAATARLGEAKADYFPRFVLLGSAGRQAAQLHDLTLSLGNYFSFGPAISLPLFTGGKISSNVTLQDARLTEALLSYQAIILTALEETENALSAYGNEQERCDRLAASVQSNETAFELANVQYSAGLTDFLTVLDALRELHSSQDLLARSRTEVMKDLVTLFRALGGGWDIIPDM